MRRELIWVGGLFIGSLLWALLMNTAMGHRSGSFQFELGAALGMGGPIFLGTGIVAGIVYAVSKSRSKALWTWTILLLVVFALLSIGGIQVTRLIR